MAMMRSVLIALILSLGVARAAETPRPDGELIAECTREISERFLNNAETEYLTIAHQEITRGDSEDRVRLTVAAGEGRTASALCKFRGGKLFDVVR